MDKLLSELNANQREHLAWRLDHKTACGYVTAGAVARGDHGDMLVSEIFEKYGGKAIFLARFVPIVRTFAPFVAGVSQMPYGFFIRWNVIGGIVWVGIFTALGYFFGNIPFVQENFELVIVAIVVISVIPAVVEALKTRKESRKPALETKS
jgi:membrane protein DedA with SNARE-associated domain